MATKRKRMKPGSGWAWAFQSFTACGIREGDWVLCNWSEPSREALTARPKPTPDAVPVYVRITEAPKKRAKRKP